MVCRNSQSVCQLKRFCFIILSFTLFSLFSECLLANNYLSLLQEGSTLRYEHWDLESKEVTGYSNFLQIYLNEKKQWVEQNANTKPDGKVFTRKQLIFSDNGQIELYTEEDLRDIYKVSTTYHGTNSESVLNKAGEIWNFKQQLDKGTVPLELIMLHMRSLMPELLKDKKVKFPIYASMLALELEEKGLPQSLSQLEMIAEPIKKQNYSAPWGAQEALQVDLYPASWTVRALLPAEKSRFRFYLATSTPYLILEFEEGKTRHTLLDWDNGDSKIIDEIKPLF
jgi:hypothetical protein